MTNLLRTPETLVFTPEQAAEWRSGLRKAEAKLVMTNGCFDLIHRGHVEYLFQTRMLGDALIIALNSDASVRSLKGPSRPINKELDRAYVLASLACVDAVVVFDTPRCDWLFEKLTPDIYVKGGDYTLSTIDKGEKAVLESVGAEIRFIPFIGDFSSSSILAKLSASV